MSELKVFGVGLNKTGTTTLADMLGQLGLRHQIWTPTNFALYQSGDTGALIQESQRYDSFTDWPWPLMVRELIAFYGENARFILTKRSDARTWIESLKAHALATKPGNHARRLIYGYEYPQENEGAHIRLYEDHIEQTRQILVDAKLEHLLLEICWEQGDGWAEVAGFLRKPTPERAVPHQNSNASRRKLLPYRVANLERIGALVAREAI